MINTKGRMDAVMAEVEAMKPMLRKRREEDQGFYCPQPITCQFPRCDCGDDQFDRDRDLDERGITSGGAYGEEHPMQSSATSRRY